MLWVSCNKLRAQASFSVSPCSSALISTPKGVSSNGIREGEEDVGRAEACAAGRFVVAEEPEEEEAD